MKYKLKLNTTTYVDNIYDERRLKYIIKKRLEYQEHLISFSDNTFITSNNLLHVQF